MAQRDLPAYLGTSGWGDGPGWLRGGAKVFLTHEDEKGLVFYLDGPEPPDTPGRSAQGGYITRASLAFLVPTKG